MTASEPVASGDLADESAGDEVKLAGLKMPRAAAGRIQRKGRRSHD
jgi:hypothetical protein